WSETMDFSTLLEEGQRTLTENKSAREIASELRAQAHWVRYRSRRWRSIQGASDLDSEQQRIREVLRAFVSAGCYGGFSRGSTCGACGKTIRRLDLEYDLVVGGVELRIDQACYRLLLEEQEASGAENLSPGETAF